MKRISDEDIESLVLKIIGNTEGEGSSIESVNEELRKAHWDIDDNDFREAISSLFAKGKIMFTFDRRLKKVNSL